MSIKWLRPSERIEGAATARRKIEFLNASKSESFVLTDERTDDPLIEQWRLIYPHVWLQKSTDESPGTLVKYAWQFVCGTGEQPISYEVPATDDIGTSHVAVVWGPRLAQIVDAILGVYDSYSSHQIEYCPMVLHERSIGLCSIILEAAEAEQSLAIPLAPFPLRLTEVGIWKLEEFKLAIGEILTETRSTVEARMPTI